MAFILCIFCPEVVVNLRVASAERHAAAVANTLPGVCEKNARPNKLQSMRQNPPGTPGVNVETALQLHWKIWAFFSHHVHTIKKGGNIDFGGWRGPSYLALFLDKGFFSHTPDPGKPINLAFKRARVLGTRSAIRSTLLRQRC